MPPLKAPSAQSLRDHLGRGGADFSGPSRSYSSGVPSSLILGAELFYMHDAYYRGLIGRTMLLDRALSAAELAELMKLGS